MLHQIKVRKVTNNEKSPFLNSDEEKFQLKLRALIEDISNLPDVISAVQNGMFIDVETKIGIKYFLKETEKLFIRYGDDLRYDGLPWGKLEA